MNLVKEDTYSKYRQEEINKQKNKNSKTSAKRLKKHNQSTTHLVYYKKKKITREFKKKSIEKMENEQGKIIVDVEQIKST